MSKPTESPWTIEAGSGDYIAVEGPDGEVVCILDGEDMHKALANASLITAAPLMLRALKVIRRRLAKVNDSRLQTPLALIEAVIREVEPSETKNATRPPF